MKRFYKFTFFTTVAVLALETLLTFVWLDKTLSGIWTREQAISKGVLHFAFTGLTVAVAAYQFWVYRTAEGTD